MQKNSKRYKDACRALEIGRRIRTEKHLDIGFIVNRFWSKVEKGLPDECWNWTDVKRAGYGRFCVKGKLVTASRFAWEQTHGKIPNGKFCCHTCDNPSCCNPNHLFLGTKQENLDDSIKKGRFQKTRLRGERHGMCKLSEEIVKQIRIKYASGMVTYRDLISETGIPKSTISHIITGYTWKHI